MEVIIVDDEGNHNLIVYLPINKAKE